MAEEKSDNQKTIEVVHNIVDSATSFFKAMFPLVLDFICKIKKYREDREI